MKNVFYRKYIQLPGASCSIYGCRTSRKHFGVSIFRIPTKDDDLSTKLAKRWRGLSQRTLDREIDASLRNQNAQQTIHVCEKHFEKHLIETCKLFSYNYSLTNRFLW